MLLNYNSLINKHDEKQNKSLIIYSFIRFIINNLVYKNINTHIINFLINKKSFLL